MLILNFHPFPNLETERLLLRQLAQSDETEVFFLRSAERIAPYMDRPKAKSLKEAQNFIQRINAQVAANEVIFWGITLKTEIKLIGTICLWQISRSKASAEVGYELHPDFQGQGIMQEALKAVLNFGFEQMKLQLINATVSPENQPSIKLLEKFHFKLSKKEEEENTVLYQLSASHPDF